MLAITLPPAVPVTGTAPWVRLIRERPAADVPAPARARAASPREVAELLRPVLEAEEVEVFVVLCLDVQHRVLARVEVTRGILNTSLVHAREVFRVAIALGAASIILAHNHPSGDPTPSPEDRAVTRDLVAAGRILDIPVHDHVILGAGGRYVSLAESGLANFGAL